MSDSHELHLQHHYRDMEQQHDAAKLGMWLFLATEILLFGGLFCGYAVFRANHEDLFVWGEQFLDETYGAANTAVLLISSLTMAMAITYVQQEKRRAALISLGITLVCAGMFMVIKSIEYQHKFHDHLLGGMAFYQTSDHGDDMGGDHAEVAMHGDPSKGQGLWNAACRTCHGATGEGVPGQGMPLNDNAYVREHNDSELVKFITVGRAADASDSTLQLEMPPKGGNPMLKEAQIYDIVAYLRTLEIPPAPDGDVTVNLQASATKVSAASKEKSSVLSKTESFIDSIPRSTVPQANRAQAGLAPESDSEAQRMAVYERPKVPQLDEAKPANAHLFFGLYFLMTGLHGVHVVIGMIVLLWLMWRVQRGDFTKRHYAAVECGGLYWHVVDVIWIFLFPLWYLIA